MKVLDLCSGIGGFSLGLGWAGMETVGFCEIEPFCQQVLRKHWPHVPIFEDIKELTIEHLIASKISTIDLVCGGIPCQPFSVAGKKEGTKDKRHLWPEMFKVIKEVRPRWVIVENVVGIVRMALGTVLSDLEGEGFCVQTFNIPASALNAPHERKRIWIVAYAECNDDFKKERKVARKKERVSRVKGKKNVSSRELSGTGFLRFPHQRHDFKITSNTHVSGLSVKGMDGVGFCLPDWWNFESRFCKLDDGFSEGMDRYYMPPPTVKNQGRGRNKGARLKALGNAVVPQVVFIIGKYIMDLERDYL